MSMLQPLSDLTLTRPWRATSHFRDATPAVFQPIRQLLALLLGAFLFLALTQAVFAANFTASLDRDSISLGESASLNLTFEDGQPTRMPTIPQVANLQIGDAAGDSSQTLISNGKVTYSRVVSFPVTSRQLGKYVIPAITVDIGGQIFTSQPLTLTVGKSATASSKNTFLKLVLPKNEAYLGEMIPLEIQLYFQVARGGEPPHVQEAGFTLGKLVQTGQSATVLDGRRFNVASFKTFVTPVRAGKIELGPATMNLNVPAPNAHQNIFGEIDSWQSVTAESQPETLQVNPLPKDNVPATFNGAVGTFSVVVSASPTNVAVEEPITVKVQISGTGALDGVTLPSQEAWQQFKLYPPTSEFQPGDQLGMSGTKTFSLTAVPQNIEIKELPPFSFGFFDPAQKKYRTVTQPAIPLIVRPSAASLPPPVLSANPAETQSTNNDIVPIKVRVGDVRPRSPAARRPARLSRPPGHSRSRLAGAAFRPTPEGTPRQQSPPAPPASGRANRPPWLATTARIRRCQPVRRILFHDVSPAAGAARRTPEHAGVGHHRVHRG